MVGLFATKDRVAEQRTQHVGFEGCGDRGGVIVAVHPLHERLVFEQAVADVGFDHRIENAGFRSFDVPVFQA